MASKRIKACNSSSAWTLPEELLVKIFLQQSLETLGQLSCVCKSWNQIISGKYFIKTHLDHQKSSSNVNKYVLLDHLPTFLLNNIDMGPLRVVETFIYDADDIFGRDLVYNCLEIYGICDGVFCLSEGRRHWHHSNHRIFLWNPFLKKAKKLPQLGSEFKVEQKGPPCLCFGHHGDDYKVININPCRDGFHVYVYSLSTDSWKFLKFDIIAGTNDTYKFNISWYPKVCLVNGVAYFIQCSCSDGRDGRIVSFDLSCEIIRYIKMPKDFDFSVNHVMKEYRESIALVSCGDEDMVMWVLRGSDNSFTWDKKFIVKTQDRQLLGFMNNEELVIRNSDKRVQKCFLYNVENGFEQRFRTLDLETSTLSQFLHRIHYLTESLVLLGESTTISTSRRKEENEGNEDRVRLQKRYVFFKLINTNMESFTDQSES